MRRIREFILSLVSAIIVLLGVAFAFIELRLILSGDWLLYNTALAGFLQYFLRFIMSLIAAATGIVTIIFRRNIARIILYAPPCMMIGAIAIAFTVSPMDIVFAGVALAYYLSFAMTAASQSDAVKNKKV
jgi:hypothetical protein